MSIRLSGLNSGMDTDAIVQALMSAQNYKKTKIQAKQTKLEWKKELWGELNTKIYNFYTNTLGKMRLQGTFKTKAATSSDNSKVTATATSAAAEGTYKVKVNSLASAQYVTSGKLNGAKERDKEGNLTGTIGKVSASSKLIDLVGADKTTSTFAAGTQIVVAGKKGTATLLVDENTKVSDFVKTCQDAGLTASFDADQQRFFIGSDTSGADQGFTITSSALTTDQLDSIKEWKEAVGYAYLSSTDKSAVSKIFDKLQAGTIDEEKANESLKKYVEKSKNAAVNAYYKKEVTDTFKDYFEYDVSDPTKKTGITQDGINALLADGKTQAQIDKMSDKKKIEAVNALVNKKVAAELKTQTYQDKIKDGIENGISGASDAILSAGSIDDNLSQVESKVTKFHTEMDASKLQDNSDTALAGFGLSKVTGSKVDEKDAGNTAGMVVVEASDASITFNGATLTSSTSTLTVNGLTLNVLDKTDSEISISVAKDTSAIYDTIKDFISEYNDILKTMNSYYNAASSRGYDVLTDEQKEAMTESEVEKWEDKIKSSLLRRDDTLNSIISSFRTNMMGGYTASDGKRYSLASLGIATSAKNWYEGGLLHIKGDEDDTEYMDETNKLEAMLTKDPELVMEIMNGLTGKLYTDLQKKMRTSKMSSAFTFYNDKEMNSQLSDYKTQVSKWEKKLAALEDRYYKQFTAMEKAMASLNSQQNYFSSMMG